MTTLGSPMAWAGFTAFILVMLALDLGVFHRKAHVVSMREAGTWSVVWVVLAALFGAGLWRFGGSTAAVEFATGYLIEKALSVDNLFIFLVIFTSLAIPAQLQHRVLFWGILSALVLRFGMILAGGALLARFHWLMYVFGAFLILTGLKLLWAWRKGSAASSPGEGWLIRAVQRVVPSTAAFDGARFFTHRSGRWLATPTFLALVLVEVSDVVFALDSIPAVFAVTRDPFIVFTSNVFAILGLRSLFFLLAGVMERFSALKVGLAAVLVFVGLKMALVDVVKIPALLSCALIAAMLGTAVCVSWLGSARTSGRRRVEPAEAPVPLPSVAPAES
jgi:tellurite resistance protein TerC